MTDNTAAVDHEIRALAAAGEAYISNRARELAMKYGMELREAANVAADEWQHRKMICGPQSCALCRFVRSAPLGTESHVPSPKDCGAYTCPWERME